MAARLLERLNEVADAMFTPGPKTSRQGKLRIVGGGATLVVLVTLWGIGWFACDPSARLYERLCPPEWGFRSMEASDYPGPYGRGSARMGSCECMDGSRKRVWPWSRVVAWLTAPEVAAEAEGGP